MEKNCTYCNTHFTAKRNSRKYCSDNCKQMAYFKRNGLILSGKTEIGFLKYETPVIVKEDTVKCNSPIPEVKYEKEAVKVKQRLRSDTIAIDQRTLDAIVNIITIAMEKKLQQELAKAKQELIVKYESLIVKPDFAISSTAEDIVKQFCNPVSFTGLKRQTNENEPKIKYCNASERLIVKYPTLAENTISPLNKNQQEHFTVAPIKEAELIATPYEKEDNDDWQEEEETETEEQESLIPDQVQALPLASDEEQDEEEEREDEEEEEPYQWIESKIIKSIEKNYVNSKEHLFKEPLRYWDAGLVKNVNWISERLLCLTESMIKLSNYNKIDKHTLFCITDAFNRLVKSKAYMNLPDNYPFIELIKELCIKLNRLVQSNEYSEQLKFSLSSELKSRLISARYEMLDYFQKSKFSELDFTEEKTLLEKHQEDQDEKMKSEKKGWQVRYEALKRKQLREAA